jgi:hypothetical protein
MMKKAHREAGKPNIIFVSKPPFFERMDKLAQDRTGVKKILQDLEKGRAASLLEIGVLHQYLRRAGGEADHARYDWFDAERGWWRHLPPIEPVLRAAFIQAGKLVLKHRLPLDTYWLRGAEQFQVVICKSRQQITMLICSPFPPRPFAKLVLQKNTWVFDPSIGARPVRRSRPGRTRG